MILLVSLMVPIADVAAAPPGLETSGLAHKVLSGPDDEGDLEISVKVSVRNTTEADQEAQVIIRAVDKEEFEVFEVRLSGKVKAGQTRVLTDTQFISEKLYKSIVRWEVEE
jgi:hypothetical protein